MGGCPCCGDDLRDIVSSRMGEGSSDRGASRGPGSSPSVFAARVDEAKRGGFVDVHAHLDEVFQEVQRHRAVPSLSKLFAELTEEEMKHWRTLGWARDRAPAPVEAAEEAPAKRACQVWSKSWSALAPAERRAATELGYVADSWDRNVWLLPHARWCDLPESTRGALVVLGEGPESWDAWKPDFSGSQPARIGGPSVIFNTNDLRTWFVLTEEERSAARSLGFTEASWDMRDECDIEGIVRDVFGPSFEGCVTQGCDLDSMDAAEAAARHPKIFVSFGCHPKSAWAYDDAFEQRILAALKRCGEKAVAWGEFGLDYSHPYFGRLADNRRKQKEVFARQLQLAVSMRLPLVIHSRAADRDTLRMMRRWVPRDWKVHIHSFRGSVQFMKVMLSEYQNCFIGIPGVVTMDDESGRELCRRCPLERIVVETDAPYLPLSGHYYAHPGLIPEIIVSIAELHGRPVAEVAGVVRENARALFGI